MGKGILLVSGKQGKKFRAVSTVTELFTCAEIWAALPPPSGMLVPETNRISKKDYHFKGETFSPASMQCTCNEFSLLSSAYPPRDIRRCCFHLSRWFVQFGSMLSPEVKLLFKERLQYGYAEIYTIPLKNDTVIITRKEKSDWLNIFFREKKFAFFVPTRRWKNNLRPECELPFL